MGRIILYRFGKKHPKHKKHYQNKLKSSIRYRQGALCNFSGRDGLVLLYISNVIILVHVSSVKHGLRKAFSVICESLILFTTKW